PVRPFQPGRPAIGCASAPASGLPSAFPATLSRPPRSRFRRRKIMPRRLRKTLAATALLLAAALPSAGQAPAAPFRLVTTDLTAQLVPNSVMDLALQLGYFAREGIEVELVRVQQTPSAVAALQAGEGDMANISVDAALQLVARDQM